MVSLSGRLRIAAIPTLEFAEVAIDVFPAETVILMVAFEDEEVVKNSAAAESCIKLICYTTKSQHSYLGIAETFEERCLRLGVLHLL